MSHERIRLDFFGIGLLVLIACGLSAPMRAGAASTDLEERARIADVVLRAFSEERFSDLDELARTYRTERSRTTSGLWKLTFFYSGLDAAMSREVFGKDIERGYGALDATIGKWLERNPSSPSAHIARSSVYIGKAWAYRGSGYASAVKPENWAPFREGLARARKNLEAHKAQASIDPRWYDQMLLIARGEAWERAEFDALLNEALAREPLYYQTYFTALAYLLPKWHGSAAEIEAFAQDAVRRTAKLEGRGMYARIYWVASATQFQNDMFKNSMVSWERMKGGFDDVVARYPDAWNLNSFAAFACLARDKEKTGALLARIGPDVVEEAWTPRSRRRECVEWATT